MVNKSSRIKNRIEMLAGLIFTQKKEFFFHDFNPDTPSQE
jgi:hypothetical protein